MGYVPDVVEFLADFVTLILGIIALLGLIFRRRQLEAVLKLALTAYRTDRLNRVRLTIGRLEHLSYDDKERRPEIRALLGQLAGELAVLTCEFPQLQEVFERLERQLTPNSRWTEASRRKILSEIAGLLDRLTFAEQVAPKGGV